MIRKKYMAPDFTNVFLIGVGGTGGYLAQGLAKMISGYKLETKVTLIDPDSIEEKNCARQNFMHHEIGQLKANALASRLNQQFGLKFGASSLKGEVFLDTRTIYSRNLIISCVDKVSARKAINRNGAWLDLGNGENTGQAIFGTTNDDDVLAKQLKHWRVSPFCAEIPNAHKVGGLSELEDEPDIPSCAEQPFAEQGVFTNEWAAQAGLTILFQLLVKEEVSTPQIYFDALKGRMNPVFITKELYR